jgi:hypothetical protein
MSQNFGSKYFSKLYQIFEEKILKFLKLLGENALKLSPILRENTSQAFSDVARKYLSNFLRFWG